MTAPYLARRPQPMAITLSESRCGDIVLIHDHLLSFHCITTLNYLQQGLGWTLEFVRTNGVLSWKVRMGR